MILGFTGTSQGMTQRQRNSVRYLIGELPATELHHGDCIGADAEVHRDAMARRIEIVVHPPSDDKLRAFCDYSLPNTLLPAEPYLKRNRKIVAAGVDGLIAAPKDFVEPVNKRGQGTWTTIGYARKAGRRIWIVFPDGTFREEQGEKL